MAQVIKAPAAYRDLGQIVSYIAQDNLPAALRWLEETEKLLNLLAEQPGVGQRVKTRRFGEIRCHTMGNYLIYYRPIVDGVQILTVAHGARDQSRLI
jgi:toxin ParE1/3/4